MQILLCSCCLQTSLLLGFQTQSTILDVLWALSLDANQHCPAFCCSQRLPAAHSGKCFPLNREKQDIGGKIKSPYFPALNQTKPSSTHTLLSQLNNKNNLPISPHTETFGVFIKSKGKVLQNFSSPPGTNCRNSFQIICCYFLWNHWMNQMRSERVGYFLYQKHDTNKDKKILLLSRAALLGQNCQCCWAKNFTPESQGGKSK